MYRPFFVLLYLGSLTVSAAEAYPDEELELVQVKGPCPSDILAIPGEPTEFSLNLNTQIGRKDASHSSCIFILDVKPHTGFRVGLRGPLVSGEYHLEATGFASVRARYHFLRSRDKKVVSQKWTKDSARSQSFSLEGESTILWGPCEQQRFVMVAEVSAGGFTEKDRAQVTIDSITLPEIVYKRCSP